MAEMEEFKWIMCCVTGGKRGGFLMMTLVLGNEGKVVGGWLVLDAKVSRIASRKGESVYE